MFFQARGPGVFRELSTDGNFTPGIGFEICLDSIAFNPKVNGAWSHENKCGLVDVEDASGYNSLSGDLTLSFSDVKDLNFALAALGVVNAAAGGTSTVTNEVLPGGGIGGIAYLGGKERHRNITAATIHGDGSPTGPLLTLNTDYTLDVDTGKVVYLTAQTGGCTASYTHQDPAAVAMMAAAQKEYAFDMDFYNRQAANQKGALELYRIRPDPATGMDFLSAAQQTLSITAKVLADTSRVITDTEFGPFGRRVNVD
jgi:hypothetical protein